MKIRKGGIVLLPSKFNYHRVKSKYATQSTRTWALLTPIFEHAAVNNIMENSEEDLGEIVNNMSLEERAVAIRQLDATSTLPVAVPLLSSLPEAWSGVTEAQFALRGVVDEMLHHYLVLEVLPEAAVGSVGGLAAIVSPPGDAYQKSLAGLALPNRVPTEGEAAPGPAY